MTTKIRNASIGIRLALVQSIVAAAVIPGCSDEPSSDNGGSVELPPRSFGDGGAEAGDSTPPDSGKGADCPAGSTHLGKVTCNGPGASAPASVATAFAGVPGGTTSLEGFEEEKASCLPATVCSPDGAPTLLFSDSPESPRTDGVLYADTVRGGNYRLYVYQANGGTDLRKFPIVVLNQGTADATVGIVRRGTATPSTDYVGEGKAVLAQWIHSKPAIAVTVGAGKRVLLDPDLDAQHAAENELVHAIYDVVTDGPLKFSFVSVLATADATATTAGLSLLPRDASHQRGTFRNADILITGTAPVGASRLRFGGGDVDPTLMGTDSTTGDAQTLLGNYGLLYRLQITGGAGGLAPRGGAWGGIATFSSGPPVLLPGSNSSVAKGAIVLGSNLADVRLASAGGSSLPVDLVVVR